MSHEGNDKIINALKSWRQKYQKEIEHLLRKESELDLKIHRLENRVKYIEQHLHQVLGQDGFNDGSFDHLPMGPPPWKQEE